MCVPHLPVGGGGGVGPIGSQDAASAGKEREIKKNRWATAAAARNVTAVLERKSRESKSEVVGFWGGEPVIIFYCRRVSLWPACNVL